MPGVEPSDDEEEVSSLTLGVLGGMGPAATLEFLDQACRPTRRPSATRTIIRVLVDINPQGARPQ
jgi:aspartate/glutamate racemase